MATLQVYSLARISFLFSIVLLFLSSLKTEAQITIVVNRIPDNTPADASIYLAGSFNEWKPNDSNYKLIKKLNYYEITLPFASSFEYKFSRGSWESVEGDINGNRIANRIYHRNKEPSEKIYNEIKSWEDIHPKNLCTIILTQLPENTPYEASIFIAGNFNDWKENDPKYQLIKQEDGTYSITITKKLDTLKYKFTRGSWQASECQVNGFPKSNRFYTDKGYKPAVINAEIEAWIDLPGNKVYFNKFILLVSVGAGAFLFFGLYNLRNRRREQVIFLIIQLLLISFTLVTRAAAMDEGWFNMQPKLLLFSDLIYFLYAPLLLIYIKSYEGLLSDKFLKKALLWFFLPFTLQVILYLPLFLVPDGKFIFSIIDHNYSNFFILINSTALVYNIVYLVLGYRAIGGIFKKQNGGFHYPYLRVLWVHFALCLIVWMIPYLNFGARSIFSIQSSWLQEEAFNSIWIVFSLASYIHLFYAVKRPELFRVPSEVQERPKPKENLNGLKTELSKIMKKDKPYLNSGLTLQELAQALNTNIHTLSRLINEGYEKNFFDFINDYRIEEFIRLVNSDQFKNYTFLAIAMEVGFSSKTTFNRAFKKSTGKTPRDYFSLPQEI